MELKRNCKSDASENSSEYVDSRCITNLKDQEVINLPWQFLSLVFTDSEVQSAVMHVAEFTRTLDARMLIGALDILKNYVYGSWTDCISAVVRERQKAKYYVGERSLSSLISKIYSEFTLYEDDRSSRKSNLAAIVALLMDCLDVLISREELVDIQSSTTNQKCEEAANLDNHSKDADSDVSETQKSEDISDKGCESSRKS